MMNLAQVAEIVNPPTPKAPAAPQVGLSWYVVQTNPNCENRAYEGIRKHLGFQVYLPIERRWVRHARKRTEKAYPLFTGYLFAAFDVKRDGWSEIQSERSQRLYGVDHILCHGDNPGRVDTQKVADIRQMERMGLFDETTGGNLREGSRITILSHAQLDLAAKIKAVTPDKRAEVVFSLFGRENVVRIPLSKIRPA